MDHDATTAFRRRYMRSALQPDAARLIRELGSPRTPAEIAALAGSLGLALDTGELAGFLDELVAAGLLLRGPALPPGLFEPLRAVVTEVMAWPASEAQAWALTEVAALEELIAAFARGPAGPARRATRGSRRGSPRPRAPRRAAARGATTPIAPCCTRTAACRSGPSSARRARRWTARSPRWSPPSSCRSSWRASGRASGSRAVRRGRAVGARGAPRVRRGAPARGARGDPRAAALRTALERVVGAVTRAVIGGNGGPGRIPAGDLRAAVALLGPPTRAGYLNADLLPRRLPGGGVGLVLGEVHGFLWLPTCLLDVLPPAERDRVVSQLRAAVRAGVRPPDGRVPVPPHPGDRSPVLRSRRRICS